jgi:membrane-associated protease RseP (regulator of RpoE activity)
VEGSAAEKAALLENDVIIGVDDTEITSEKHLREVIGTYKPGDKVTVKFLRDGKANTKDIELGKSSESSANVFFHKMGPNGGNRFFFEGDLDSEEMMKELKEKMENLDMDFNFDFEFDNDGAFLGVTPAENNGDAKGVQLGRVVEGSAAEKAGLKAGDRVTKLNGKEVNSFDELAEVISSKEAGDKLDIEYVREGKKTKASTELGKRSDSPKHKQVRVMTGPDCHVGVGSGPWAPNVIKEVNVVIEMKDCTKEEEAMLSKPAAVNFDEELALNRIEFAPNPSDGNFRLEFDLPEQKSTRILVFDQNGRRVYEEILSNFNGSYTNQIDISSQPAGVYFLIIAQDQKQFTRKIVKQ